MKKCTCGAENKDDATICVKCKATLDNQKHLSQHLINIIEEMEEKEEEELTK